MQSGPQFSLGLFSASIASIAFAAPAAYAAQSSKGTTTAALVLDCHGTYVVDTAVPYFKSNQGTRNFPVMGTHETITVTTLEGDDCEKLAAHYGISLSVGEKLAYGISLTDSNYNGFKQTPKDLAASRLGNTFSFSVSQGFKYEVDGKLPLFPLVHEEWASLLTKSGTADSKTLYGTPAFDSLNETQKADAKQTALNVLEGGNALQDDSPNSAAQNPAWLALVLSLAPSDAAGVETKKEHLGSLLNVFENAMKGSNHFLPFEPKSNLADAINAGLNTLGGTKWATKLQVWKTHPALFNENALQWKTIGNTEGEIPRLTSAELDVLVPEMLAIAKELADVPQAVEANLLLSQYVRAAQALLAFADPKDGHPALFPLSENAKAAAADLASLD